MFAAQKTLSLDYFVFYTYGAKMPLADFLVMTQPIYKLPVNMYRIVGDFGFQFESPPEMVRRPTLPIQLPTHPPTHTHTNKVPDFRTYHFPGTPTNLHLPVRPHH